MAEQISADVSYFTNRFVDYDLSRKKKARAVTAIQVVTLGKLMTLALDGYACDWLSYEECLAWCLVAGKMLQSLCNDWGAFTQHMLDSYDVIKAPAVLSTSPGGNVTYINSSDRSLSLQSGYQKSVNQLKSLKENPRRIPWLTPLDVKTGPDINAEKLALPSDFEFMPELDSIDALIYIDDLQKPARDLALFIEAGDCSVLDVEVTLHIATSAVFNLMKENRYDRKIRKGIKDSFCGTVNKIFNHYSIAIDAFKVWKIHVPPKEK
jgi:hypothetical protein